MMWWVVGVVLRQNPISCFVNAISCYLSLHRCSHLLFPPLTAVLSHSFPFLEPAGQARILRHGHRPGHLGGDGGRVLERGNHHHTLPLLPEQVRRGGKLFLLGHAANCGGAIVVSASRWRTLPSLLRRPGRLTAATAVLNLVAGAVVDNLVVLLALGRRALLRLERREQRNGSRDPLRVLEVRGGLTAGGSGIFVGIGGNVGHRRGVEIDRAVALAASGCAAAAAVLALAAVDATGEAAGQLAPAAAG